MSVFDGRMYDHRLSYLTFGVCWVGLKNREPLVDQVDVGVASKTSG